MFNVVKKIIDTFASVKFLLDGIIVEIVPAGVEVEYWATTSDGNVLFGMNRDGLDKILAALGVIEERELAQFQGQLDDIAERAAEIFELANLEVIARGDEIWFRVAGFSTYGWKFVEFIDVETLLSFDITSDEFFTKLEDSRIVGRSPP